MDSSRPLEVDVLGPIRVRDGDGGDRTPDGTLQRRLLALLVLRRGHVVSAAAAIDALWPTGSPRDPAAALHNQVSRLRRRLPGGLLEAVDDGYRIDAARLDVDAERLAAAVALAPSDDGERAARLAWISDVLARWHGPAYPELDDLDDGVAEASHLEELRIRAREARAELLLAGGDADGAAVELAGIVDAEPLRERPVELLMAALAAAGRQADALRAYDGLRRRLGEELGIDPSPALTAQHDELLARTGVGGWQARTRLPSPASSIVGRDALVEQVGALAGEQRVVTLVGPGGVGKTRVALEVCHRSRRARPGRPVVVCELASTGVQGTTPFDAVAAALRIDGRPGVDAVDRIVDVLGDADVLLVLDNCEHVLAPVAQLVGRLVADCPGATVLATSQERLRLPGEHVVPVPALTADGGTGPAVELFVERARAVVPDFEPDAAAAGAITELVARLDGLPLAIELAAARLHTHALDEVAAGLDRRFALLSGGSRTSERHGSLHAALSWSHSLLDEHLQRTLAQLSCFAGPFDLDAAAAVCAQPPEVVADSLTRLVEQSLVQRAPGRRWLLLETVRAFGAEQLAVGDLADEVADRHAEHHLSWVADADRRLADDGSGAIGEIDAALPELRAALDRFLEAGKVTEAGRLVAALRDYGFLRLRPDVLAWSSAVMDADPAGTSPNAADVWGVAAYASWMAGDTGTTDELVARARRRAEADGGPMPSIVAALCGNVALFAGRLDEAVTWYRTGTELAGDDPARWTITAGTEVLARSYAGDPSALELADEVLAVVGPATSPLAAYAWYCVGEADVRGDVERARERLTRAIQLAEPTGAAFVVGVAGASRASIDARDGDPLVAAEEYRRLIAHWRAAGMWATQWTMLRSIALLLARLERWDAAAVLEGAVRSTNEGHRIFGADEEDLARLSHRLRGALGGDAYEDALRRGSVLDGDAAVEHALRAL